MNMTTKTPANITMLEDAAASKWLASTLAAVRERTQLVPTDEALDRIRMRVFGTTSPRKQHRSIAA